MKNLNLLPTDKPSRLVKIYNDVNRETFTLKLDVEVNDSFKEYINVYVTSDEEIEDGCILLIIDDFETYIHEHKGDNLPTIYHKKIILTTDQDLIADGVQAIDDEFLNWFVKNPSCESVEVKSLLSNNGNVFFGYKIIITKEESKQELSLKINDEFLDTTSKEILYTLMEEFDNLVTENSSEETLEEFSRRRFNEQKLDTYTSYNIEDAIKEGAKWQMNKQDEFTLGFLHWYNTSQECETYLRRNYPKNITMNGEHYKKVLQINKELLEMYKNTLPR